MMIEAWKPVWAGGQIHVWELCQGLVKDHGCEVDLFVMNLFDIHENKEYPSQEVYCDGKFNIFRVGKKCQPHFSSRLKWCHEVMKVIALKHRQKSYDLIHAHANLPGLPGKLLGKKLHLPIVYTVHGCGLKALTEMYGNNFKTKILYLTENYLQTKIKYDLEITVDSSFLQYPNHNKNIVVIPNGVDIARFDQMSVPKSKHFKIIYVGRIHPQKGLTYLLDALAIIKKELEERKVEVHLVGSGELEAELKEKSQRLGLDNIVRFRGKIYGDELIREYKSSHLFVLPSLYEGQPLTLLEAWAARLPVIVTDVGGNRDFVTNEKNGYIIPSRNPVLLAENILKALKNKDLPKMGEKGYALVKEKYLWSNMVNTILNNYSNLLKSEK